MNRISSPDYRWIFVAQLYFGFAAWGSIQVFSENAMISMLFALLIASAATMWVAFDTRHRQSPLPHAVLFLIFLTWVIALPLYLIWTRRIRGLGWAALHFIGLFLTLYLSFILSMYITGGPDAVTL
jgi:hypothetical protein